MSLYPPIVASSMPAFDIEEGKVRVYYTLPNYNSIEMDQIVGVQFTVRRQTSNVNVLRLQNNRQIAYSYLHQDEQDKALNRYYIEITSTQVDFQPDVLYKVQLRFTSLNFEQASSKEVEIFYQNMKSFSQWSTVCIIKPILAPQFYIDDFHVEGQNVNAQVTNRFFYSIADFVGIYKLKQKQINNKIYYSTESLKAWRLRLLKGTYTKGSNIEDYLLSDSGWVASSANNYTLDNKSLVLTCSLPYQFSTNDSKNNNSNVYKLLFEINTRNDYHGELLEEFQYYAQTLDGLTGQLKTYTNEEEGYIKITFSGSPYFGNLVLRRTDSKSDFLKWEDLKFFESHSQSEGINFVYYDFTAQSGILYRYLIQKIDARGRRYTPTYDQCAENNTATMVEYQHPFLLEMSTDGTVSKVKQLKLKYDFQISSYKTNISQHLTDTIGSKYPFIRRNGNKYYRSFPCSGTITEYMDEAQLFITENELFENHLSLYKEYKRQTGQLGIQYDYTYERKFREQVEKFLYNSNPKLYKSMQQGNILVKIMDVSLAPKNELGRLIYSFSATAYEIDQACIDNYNNYGLISVGQYNPFVTVTRTKIAQLSSYSIDNYENQKPFPAGIDIIGSDSELTAALSVANLIKYNKTFNGAKVTDFSIDWLRLTIDSNPYLIRRNGKNYQIVNDSSSTNTFGDIVYPLYQIESTYKNLGEIYLGHLFYINNSPIIVSYPNNIYQIKESNFNYGKNISIIPAKDTIMTVDFRVNYKVEEDISTLPKKIQKSNVNGQLVGIFSEQTDLISQIRTKYSLSYTTGTDQQDKDKIYRFLSGVRTILVDTQPGAIIKMRVEGQVDRESGTQLLHRFVVNETGVLNFDPGDDSTYIKEFKICGVNLLATEIEPIQIEDFSEITPINGNLYTDGQDYKYYFRTTWYLVEPRYQNDSQEITSYDISCPIDALVFYFAAIERDFY